MANNSIQETIDHDGLWKKVVENLIEDFMAFFFPDLYPQIDFKKGVDFLDQELLKLFPESESKKRYVDKLIKFHLKNGTEEWILIHVEIQGYTDDDFAKRMFVYWYRIFDKFDKKITALAVLTDDNKSFKPDRFKYEFFKTKLTYTFRLFKVINQKEKKLEQSDNPFAMAILAVLFLRKAKQDDYSKYEYKIKLMKLLSKKGIAREKINHLFIFIDKVLSLPEDLKEKYNQEIEKMKEDKVMSEILTDFTEKYFYEGRKVREREIARKMLKKCLDIEIIQEVTDLSLEEIEKIKHEL